jgi:molecular chaperone DnaK (HSP70)
MKSINKQDYEMLCKKRSEVIEKRTEIEKIITAWEKKAVKKLAAKGRKAASEKIPLYKKDLERQLGLYDLLNEESLIVAKMIEGVEGARQ